jgi:hypothetical protein
MGTTSQYVLDRRKNPYLIDDGDLERMIRAEAKRERRQRNAKEKEQTGALAEET